MKEPTIITNVFKDHTVQNPIDDLSIKSLPPQALSVHNQPIRNIYITIQVLDKDEKTVIETITGKAESGSISADNKSLIRRIGNLTLAVEEDLFPQQGSLMWFNRYVKIYAGIKDNSPNSQVYNFLMGTFLIGEASYTIDGRGARIDVSLHDKMLAYDEKKLELPLKINRDVPIHIAMRMIMEHIGETKFGTIVESQEYEVVPYTLEYNPGDNIVKIITTLRDMYMDYTCGYNVKGEFEFKKISTQREEDVSEAKWRFDVEHDNLKTMLSFNENYSLADIRNKIIVYGNTSEITGLTPIGETRITDTSSPFNVYAIGERPEVIVESQYVTNEQCISKAKYEAWNMASFREVCDIDTIPLYLLDLDDVIEVRHPFTKKVSKYVVDSFSVGLGVADIMSIKAHKIYYVSLNYGKEKEPLVEAIIKGISNWGWLSLGEERIRDCYNIMASGQATLSVRFQDVVSGGEQASVTSYPTTKNQTLTIDLADFAELDFKNENGANNRSTGDYADRVLAHEMFHAVCNDYLGFEKSNSIPTFFHEGAAEFIHGARERYLSEFSDISSVSVKKREWVTLCEKVLNEEWEGTNQDYVCAYLIMVAIYKLCTPEQWKNLFINLKKQENLAINFLHKLLPIADTNDQVKQRILNMLRGSEMNDIWNGLDDNRNNDTMSVGGKYFMNIFKTELNAENVFNNANAKDVSLGFKVQFIK
ncbi:flagellin [Aerococcaceae bacterium zg-B36]|uniref:flagellin n=1 Tax=Aerococcaceae bacterium zg-252 TaxID=2796928 RepID=UPI001BD81515|nr:flagellin [Aerococcaceae bacterium zg-B36]